ncbi:MAG: hypothetical protein A2Z99_06120 [Treponema sp. GWB1_62_6]|nr:MAG: hypothetical protein A2Z99_06120 [Treponema sp. GWB1_62_6]OHE69448.1 MAG: hypothetical protein A2001_18860 [Treponema sp. GWC1_61_84]OHE71637.1 MAG: hypothetical protein A2413_01955 [Treponema sp. RIFOXYC1_FULL_61_9]HCM25160.1 hypothetical protein [Treponema sp.]
MNQDRVKELLLSVEDAPMDFSVVFSGKQSKKVNGLYKPDTREILIHNRNFKEDNMLMYTAVHEYAHHLHCCSRGGKLSARAHSAEFWSILHGLLQKAEDEGVYKNVFADSPELESLTETIRKKCLYENGSLVKELGKLLMEANTLCTGIGARFEDYIDRVLRIPRVAARTAMKIYQYNVNPSMGADNMKIVAGIGNDETRTAAEGALLSGKSPDEVKVQIARRPVQDDPKERLEKEKLRLERTIQTLTKRLEEVERELED